MNRTRRSRARAAFAATLAFGLPLSALAQPLPPVAETPPMTQPDYLVPVRDPVFGTTEVRVTRPGLVVGHGGLCGPRYCTHDYSTAQAWNADQSLLLIENGCNGGCFLDGTTDKPLFQRAMPNECVWHPTDPATMICVAEQSVYLWEPRANRIGIIIPLDGVHEAAFGPYKGNPTAAGDRIVVRARDGANRLLAFAVDLASGLRHTPVALDTLPGTNNYCTISASGRYIVCGQDLPGERETLHVFTVDGAPVQHWNEHHRPGHGDLSTDPDGEDVYVGISKSDPDRFHVIKRRLRDGAVTDLLPYGQISHVSARNIRRPGWACLSFTGTRADVEGTPADGKAPFYQEIVMLRTDGSGEYRRLAQTRNAAADYWSETHASPSPDGSRVIWSSNWGVAGGPVSDFVTEVPWPSPDKAAGGALPNAIATTRQPGDD